MKAPEELRVELTFTERLLGSVAPGKEQYEEFILGRLPAEEQEEALDELETVPEEGQPNLTTFHQDPELGLILYNYVIKGFLKQALEVLQETGSVRRIPRYKHRIDSLVFVEPRKLPLGKSEPDGQFERSLRVLTRRGPRTLISVSDYVEAGTKLKFKVYVFPNPHISLDLIRECLDYGRWKGLGQWNSADWGRFTWREL